MTSRLFLERACQWVFDRGTLLVHDHEFLPAIRQCGASDEAIARLKGELERSGALKNHYVIGGMSDFTLSKSVFHQYVKKVMPEAFSQAQAIYETWKHSPSTQFTAALLSEQLKISETHGRYLLDALSNAP